MATRVNQKLALTSIDNPLINVRELILLTFGLTGEEMTSDQAFTMIKNLEIRMLNMLAYKVKNQDIFKNLLNKLLRDGVLQSRYCHETSHHLISLTPFGEGEYDYLLYSIATQELLQIFGEFKSLIELFW